MAGYGGEIDTFTIPKGRRRRVYQPGQQILAEQPGAVKQREENDVNHDAPRQNEKPVQREADVHPRLA
jgi:hypothetical protein